MPIVGSFAGASARAYGLGAGIGFRATGGTITTSGAYTIHTFLNSTENFVIQSGTKTVEYLAINFAKLELLLVLAEQMVLVILKVEHKVELQV